MLNVLIIIGIIVLGLILFSWIASAVIAIVLKVKSRRIEKEIERLMEEES